MSPYLILITINLLCSTYIHLFSMLISTTGMIHLNNNKSFLHLVGSSILLHLIDDARSNKNQIYWELLNCDSFIPLKSCEGG